MSSGGASEGFEEMDGVLSLSFMLPGLTVDSSEKSRFVLGPALGTRLAVESVGGELGMGESGRGWSSREKMERSSPFH